MQFSSLLRYATKTNQYLVFSLRLHPQNWGQLLLINLEFRGLPFGGSALFAETERVLDTNLADGA